MNDIVKLYNSLKNYIKGLRDRFEMYEKRGMELSQVDCYQLDKQRRRKGIIREGDIHNNVEFDGKLDMKINTFLVIIDKLATELERRADAYHELHTLFGFLDKLKVLPSEDIRKSAENLVKNYPKDVACELIEECVHFQVFVKDLEVKSAGDSLKLIREKHLTVLFSNLDIVLRIFMSILPSNASGE